MKIANENDRDLGIAIEIARSKILFDLEQHFRSIGFDFGPSGELVLPGTDKNTYRALHKAQRTQKIIEAQNFLNEKQHKYIRYFADGTDVCPQKIRPVLEQIKGGTIKSELFRYASLTWSIPVSSGYGRRIRFLVWDAHTNKLMGLIALGDPVFNLRIRDELIGWDVRQREERLVNIMDAYVLGALPPYNMLLGGKLIACLVRSVEVRKIFQQRYSASKGLISKKTKKADLSLVTTSSALGRSSVYNRLSLDGQKYFEPIGYTAGFGHFHIPDGIFTQMREYLHLVNHPYVNDYKFGGGPNWRLRVVDAALSSLGISPKLISKHGIQRQVFVCRYSNNAEKILRGESKRPIGGNLKSVNTISKLALDRWIIPRSKRVPEYLSWKKEGLTNLIS